MSAKAPEVKVTLDKERYLRLNFFTMEFFQEKTGQDIFAIAQIQDGNIKMGMSTIIDFTWAMLADEEPELERGQVARMIHPGNATELVQAYTKLVDLATPKDTPKGAKGKN